MRKWAVHHLVKNIDVRNILARGQDNDIFACIRTDIVNHISLCNYNVWKSTNIAKNKKMMSQCHRYVLTSLVVRNKNPPVVPHKWPVMQICLVFFCWPEQTVEQAVELLVIWYIYIHIYIYIIYIYILLAKSMEYFEAQWKHSYLTFWFAGNGLAPTTTRYCHFNTFLMHSVRDEKYNLQCPKSKLHKIIYGDLSFFNTSHKIPHSFKGIHYQIINLWECYVCSVISY